MKKILSISLLVALCLSLATAFAAPAPSKEVGLGVDGFVGEKLDFDDLVQLELPSADAMQWAVTTDYGYVVAAPAIPITNKSTSTADVKVSFVKYAKVASADATALENTGEMTLRLGGDLLLAGIPANQTNLIPDLTMDYTYANTLDVGDTWTFTFTGRYNDVLPSTAWEPAYTLSLNFEVD